jgi:hypothetical protein
MTETLLHDAFHALLPLLASHLDYFLTGLVAAALLWVRARLQVKAVETAVIEVEVDAQRDVAMGRGKAAGALKKWRAMRRSDERMHMLVRPRESRMNKLIERAWKKQQKSAKN